MSQCSREIVEIIQLGFLIAAVASFASRICLVENHCKQGKENTVLAWDPRGTVTYKRIFASMCISSLRKRGAPTITWSTQERTGPQLISSA